MKTLIIAHKGTGNQSSAIDGYIVTELEEVSPIFIEDIPINDIISYADNTKLFEAIIKNDEAILSAYLKKNGYGRFYGKG